MLSIRLLVVKVEALGDIRDLELLVDACHSDISLEIEVVLPVAVKSTENVNQVRLGNLVAGASASWKYVRI